MDAQLKEDLVCITGAMRLPRVTAVSDDTP